MSRSNRYTTVLTLFALWLAAMAVALRPLRAQDVRVRDLVIADAAPPVRLMGYGLVTGLNGTGDRVMGAVGSRQTVQSVVNLLRRFDVEVPLEMLRTRNVAAVLVTAEVSPYLRPGGHFEVRVSSLGDAQSLRGGVLWMTPLVADAGGRPLAGAQGALQVSIGNSSRAMQQNVMTALIPDGGVLEADMPRPRMAAGNKLLLRDPDLGTASRMAAAIDSALGAKGIARVEDPGAVTLALKDTTGGYAEALARVGDIKLRPARAARLVIDGRDGTVVGGGDPTVGEAVVSHAGITLTIGATTDTTTPPHGGVRMAAGSPVQKVAAALHAVQASPGEIAAIFEALREVGAIAAEVVLR
ncbi:MAG: flagellar basal body P-ring protein FlgI [Gemmatimonadetes bacterium]|nr:flagellar basal body P-ring protein FlgI [Gemmatimonadota bacterium]